MEQPPIFQAAGQADVAQVNLKRSPPPKLHVIVITIFYFQAMLDAGKRSVHAYNEFLKQNRQPAVNNPPSIIIVVLPDSAGEIRKLVKQWGDMKEDIATQCVVSRVFLRDFIDLV